MIGRFVRSTPHEGVVLHADGSTVDVMVSAGVVRRGRAKLTRRARSLPAEQQG